MPRWTFDPQKHFSQVLMQQGRVRLDADWSESAAIQLLLLRTLIQDVVGPHGGRATVLHPPGWAQLSE